MIKPEATTQSKNVFADHQEKVCPVCGGAHPARYHQSSDSHKFPGEIRHLARAKAERVCTICGKTNSIDVHHLLSIWAFKALSNETEFALLDKAVLTSIHNAVVVCGECHLDLHLLDKRGEVDPKIKAQRLEFYRNLAVSVLALNFPELTEATILTRSSV